MMQENFYNVFQGKKPLIGMLHLAGKDSEEIVGRAVEEAIMFQEEGFDGAIVEDYHGGILDVVSSLQAITQEKLKIKIGVNVLHHPYSAFELAKEYPISFIQFDTIQASLGDNLNGRRFNELEYLRLRDENPTLCVFGGVRFKYVPSTGKSLEEDIADGLRKADAIVTTGEGTGIETPIEKLRNFRRVLGKNHPLIVGAGVNSQNIRKQMEICDGAIIGSYIKDGKTYDHVIRERVRELVGLVR